MTAGVHQEVPVFARLRRFVLLLTFAVWQGGFVFYAGVVVPTGTDVHGHFGQGLVTQRVTHWLNFFGLLSHVAYFWHLWSEQRDLRTADRRRERWKWWLWGASLALLNGLALMHLKMDWLIDATTGVTADGFRGWHIAYLWVSTGQWLIALALAWTAAGRGVHFGRPAVH